MLSKLTNLDSFKLYNDGERLFSTISLKKGMTSYSLINPFILSSQFEGGVEEITSNNEGFSFNDDILEWKNLNSETKEVNISWSFKSPDGKFKYIGDSSIPIKWK